MEEWSHLTTDSAADLAEQAELEAPARELLEPDMRPEPFVGRLREAEMYPEAVAVMARALPAREAIGWACLCDRSTEPEDDPRHDALLTAVERWVRDPSDEHRGAAMELAQNEPDESSGQLLGMAVGYSAGKVSVAGNPPVEVPTETVPAMVAGAVMIAAGRADPPDVDDTYRRFVERAVEVAAGRGGRSPAGGNRRGEG